MKKIWGILFFALALTSTSCLSTVRRSYNKVVTSIDAKTLSVEKGDNIFAAYLWTTPPASGSKLDGEYNGDNFASSFIFSGKKYNFSYTKEEKSIKVTGSSGEFEAVAEIKRSSRDIYYNLNELKIAYRTVTRWVPVTVHVEEKVAVERTRQVPYQASRQVYTPDGYQRTEWYTAYRTEWYTEYETRYVSKTEWVWKDFQEPYVLIPEYDYAKITLDTGETLAFFPQEEEVYYLNLSYLSYIDSFKSGDSQKDVRVILFDSDSNGTYTDTNDRILFNTWNPYAKESSYGYISGFMNNSWYSNQYLADDLFVVMQSDGKTLTIKNANSEYIGSEELGTIQINNIEDYDINIIFNGAGYYFLKKFERKIEYGFYKLRIVRSGYIDFEQFFEVNSKNPEIVINYKPTPKAGTFTLKAVHSRDYMVVVEDENKNKRYYPNASEINLPYGRYRIEVVNNGFSLIEEFTFSEDTPVHTMNYQEKIASIATTE
ncbi:MAG: hypothetical protein JXR63_10805 [Spirochaetales bacterium]|nr:hypothetical protein [Spirochaetales bacterium]